MRKEEKPPGVMRICDLVLEKVVANALQTPMGSPLQVKGHQGGQFVFHFRADERADWAEMQKTPEGLRRYLALYPDGLYRREAEAKLVKIAEDRAWEQAAAAGSVRALLDFEAQFPQSERVRSGEVDRLIADLEEEELWRETKRFPSIGGYRDYLRRTRLGKYRHDANEAIKELLLEKEEPAAWRLAQAQNNKAAYEDFLKKYPSGAHAAGARAALQTIRQEEERREQEKQAKKEREEKRRQVAAEAECKQKAKEERRQAARRKQQQRQAAVVARLRSRWFWGGGLAIILLVTIWYGISHFGKMQTSEQLDLSENTTPIYVLPDNLPASIQKLVDDMVRVQGGTFIMGSSDSSNAYNDECPHSVSVGSFSIGKYEVTQAQWRAVMGADPSYNQRCDDCPVEQVSWDDIQVFLKKINTLTGLRFRLPTEAEWEFAAKGGTKSQGYKYAGSNNIDKVAWYGANTSSTQPVGQKLPNQLGLYDMSGNVYEWCQDTYKPYPKCSGEASSSRVLRGGSWGLTDAYYCRPSNRRRGAASLRNEHDGFRVAQD